MSECSKITALPPKVDELLASCTNLPSLPAVVIKILDASKDPDIGIADVAEILRVDPALSAKLLKVANSPLYAKRREITNLKDALTLLGLDASLTIALSFSLVASLSDNPDTKASYDSFWKRSILSATIARHIGFKLKRSNLEDIFLASLLQDIGILAIDRATPDCQCENATSHLHRIICEKNNLRIDHAEVGAWLLKSWNFPEKLFRAVSQSHTPATTGAESSNDQLFFQCVWLSGNLADIWFTENCQETIDRNFNYIHQALGYTEEDFNQFIIEINELLPEISSIFELNIIDDQHREQILQDARCALVERNLNLIKQFDEHKSQIDTLTEKTRSIEEAASRDHLTGTFNRKHIEKLLQIEFQKSFKDNDPLTLAFIDIDNFKSVNDTYGHLAGDVVIQKIAQFFKNNLRSTDKLARYGGDEFLLMLPNTTSASAFNLLSRLITELQDATDVQLYGNKFKITTSIGMATHMDGSEFGTLEELIDQADKALYNAKESGRNTTKR